MEEDKKKENQGEELESEEKQDDSHGDQEGSDSQDSDEQDIDSGDSEEPEAEPKKKGLFGKITGIFRKVIGYLLIPFNLFFRHKLAILSISCTLIVLGAGGYLARDYLLKKKIADEIAKVMEKSRELGLEEESLNPLYIPLPSDSRDRLLMVKFSVIWDRLSSIRFKKDELKIRNYLYKQVRLAAEERKNVEEKTAFLETVMSVVLRKSLGREELIVKIDELKAY